MPPTNPVVFRKGMHLGQPAAEDDEEYLLDCFIDNGNYHAAIDTTGPASILLGRTGAGKSALLRHIREDQENVIAISPEMLSLNFLANSKVIKFFEDAEVNLDLFYNLLWRHIFVVELLKRKFGIVNEDTQRSFLSRISTIFGMNKSKARAFAYLSQWGEKFWNETEYRTKEFTSKLEGKLEAELSTSNPILKGSIKSGSSLSDEQKVEVLYYGQRAVNDIQVKELHEVIQALASDIFNNKLERYYITIDRLDEDWVSEELKFKLIKALIDTIRTFWAIRPVKILVALRTDLYYTMTRRVSSFGFQEEKLSGYYVKVEWDRLDLERLLDRRVGHLFRLQYSGAPVRLRDILPNSQLEPGRGALEYILDRTFFRPREAISFFNKCIAKANGKSKLTPAMIRDAEGEYSAERLNSLYDEWRREYPFLKELCDLLKMGKAEFDSGALSTDKIEEVALNLSQSAHLNETLPREVLENAAMDSAAKGFPFVSRAIGIFYQVGLIGLKLSSTNPREWSHVDAPTVDLGLIRPDTRSQIHRTFHRALGVQPSQK